MMEKHLSLSFLKKRHDRLWCVCLLGFLMGLPSVPTFAQTTNGAFLAETMPPTPLVFASKTTAKGLNLTENAAILISGTVRDKEEEPLPGATIAVKGTTDGTIANVNGEFKLSVPNEQAILVVSYTGYLKKEVLVGKQKIINVVLETDSKNLSEVVVIGYGETANKLQQTGSISRISNDEFKATTVNTVDQILQGRVAGVNVIQTSGEPGADVIVNLRGTNSISGNNQPLYVIDGFPVAPSVDAPSGVTLGAGRVNGLFGLNPNDIETIDVLKDASATAIYGSRAANGVVLITTKKGTLNEAKIEITNKSGVGIISSPYQMMNSTQYVDIKNQQQLQNNQLAVLNVEDFANRTSTNWLKELTRPSMRQETNVSMRGGAGNTTYFLSGSHLYERGLQINSGNTRFNVRLNLNTTIKKWYSIRGQFAITKQNTLVGISQSRGWPGGGGPILNSLRAAPVFENNLEDESALNDAIDGVSLSGNPFINPVLEASIKRDNKLSDQTIANVEHIFYLNPKHTLEFHAITGTTLTINERQLLLPPLIERNNGGTAEQGRSKVQALNGSFFLLQRAKRGKHNLNNTFGGEVTKTSDQSYLAASLGLDYPSITLNNLAAGKTQRVSSSRGENIIQSAFYRFNYNYGSRYVVSGSVRLDGSSRFAANKKFGLFPSGAFSWNISEEPFFKKTFKSVDLAKLRVSYGSTGVVQKV